MSAVLKPVHPIDRLLDLRAQRAVVQSRADELAAADQRIHAVLAQGADETAAARASAVRALRDVLLRRSPASAAAPAKKAAVIAFDAARDSEVTQAAAEAALAELETENRAVAIELRQIDEEVKSATYHAIKDHAATIYRDAYARAVAAALEPLAELLVLDELLAPLVDVKSRPAFMHLYSKETEIGAPWLPLLDSTPIQSVVDEARMTAARERIKSRLRHEGVLP